MTGDPSHKLYIISHGSKDVLFDDLLVLEKHHSDKIAVFVALGEIDIVIFAEINAGSKEVERILKEKNICLGMKGNGSTRIYSCEIHPENNKINIDFNKNLTLVLCGGSKDIIFNDSIDANIWKTNGRYKNLIFFNDVLPNVLKEIVLIRNQAPTYTIPIVRLGIINESTRSNFIKYPNPEINIHISAQVVPGCEKDIAKLLIEELQKNDAKTIEDKNIPNNFFKFSNGGRDLFAASNIKIKIRNYIQSVIEFKNKAKNSLVSTHSYIRVDLDDFQENKKENLFDNYNKISQINPFSFDDNCVEGLDLTQKAQKIYSIRDIVLDTFNTTLKKVNLDLAQIYEDPISIHFRPGPLLDVRAFSRQTNDNQKLIGYDVYFSVQSLLSLHWEYFVWHEIICAVCGQLSFYIVTELGQSNFPFNDFMPSRQIAKNIAHDLGEILATAIVMIQIYNKKLKEMPTTSIEIDEILEEYIKIFWGDHFDCETSHLGRLMAGAMLMKFLKNDENKSKIINLDWIIELHKIKNIIKNSKKFKKFNLEFLSNNTLSLSCKIVLGAWANHSKFNTKQKKNFVELLSQCWVYIQCMGCILKNNIANDFEINNSEILNKFNEKYKTEDLLNMILIDNINFKIVFEDYYFQDNFIQNDLIDSLIFNFYDKIKFLEDANYFLGKTQSIYLNSKARFSQSQETNVRDFDYEEYYRSAVCLANIDRFFEVIVDQKKNNYLIHLISDLNFYELITHFDSFYDLAHENVPSNSKIGVESLTVANLIDTPQKERITNNDDLCFVHFIKNRQIRWYGILNCYVGDNQENGEKKYSSTQLLRRLNLELMTLKKLKQEISLKLNVLDYEIISINVTSRLMKKNYNDWVEIFKNLWIDEIKNIISVLDQKLIQQNHELILFIEITECLIDDKLKNMLIDLFSSINKFYEEEKFKKLKLGFAIDDQFGPGTDLKQMQDIVETLHREFPKWKVMVKIDHVAMISLLRSPSSFRSNSNDEQIQIWSNSFKLIVDLIFASSDAIFNINDDDCLDYLAIEGFGGKKREDQDNHRGMFVKSFKIAKENIQIKINNHKKTKFIAQGEAY